MLPSGCTVLCAVSGGADSVCLLHALYRLRPKLGFRLAVAHYNHHLRGLESDGDQDFVAQFVRLCCGPQHLPDGRILPAVALYTGSGDVAAQAERWGVGVEEAAREMRYAYLQQAAREIGADRIATAHTADDNAETILFHLARGSGLRGLTGIQPVRDNLIRPLLTTTRKQVEEYLFHYSLPHREDSSNANDRFSRNRIRHQVIPVLEDLCPGFAARISDTAALLRADESYLDCQAHLIAQQAIRENGCLSIPAALIGDAPDPLASRAVRQLIGQLNDGDQDCGCVHLEAVLRLCRGGDPSAQVHLPYSLMARREYDRLILSPSAAVSALKTANLVLPGSCATGPWHITVSAEDYTGQSQSPWDFWLSRDDSRTLTIRARQSGDQLTLAGRPTKSVKKWLIDEKIPRFRRDQLPVLVREEQVVAVAGLGPSADCLPSPGTKAWHITVRSL